MQLVLRGSMDKTLTFDVSLIQLSFHTSVCKEGVFNLNVTIFQSRYLVISYWKAAV